MSSIVRHFFKDKCSEYFAVISVVLHRYFNSPLLAISPERFTSIIIFLVQGEASNPPFANGAIKIYWDKGTNSGKF